MPPVSELAVNSMLARFSARIGAGAVGTCNMTPKKKVKKTSQLTTALLYIFIPITIWFLAFVAWLYWDDIAKLFYQGSGKGRSAPPAARNRDRSDAAAVPAKRSQEKILDDDRKKLEEILKQRQ